jgi:hypothetical protein
LQGYAADQGADGFSVYLVFWFGVDVAPTPRSALLRSAKPAPNVLPKAIPSGANSRAESLSRPRHGGSCERHR